MNESRTSEKSTSERRIIDFIEDLASSSPAPGGGAASAVSGALGVALTSMVYNLTVGKKSYEKLEEGLKKELDENLEQSKELYFEMLKYIDKDKAAFTALMDSYKLPKETVEDKNIRKATIKACTIEAMNVPFNLANLALKFYSNIEFAARYGNQNLISDAAVSAIMLNACIESAIVNVEVNLAYLEDEIKVKDVRNEIEHIKTMNNKFKETILEFTSSKINCK